MVRFNSNFIFEHVKAEHHLQIDLCLISTLYYLYIFSLYYSKYVKEKKIMCKTTSVIKQKIKSVSSVKKIYSFTPFVRDLAPLRISSSRAVHALRDREHKLCVGLTADYYQL